MAEQLALDHLGRQGGAAHRHERARGARAVAVQRERGEFLAGARFARQQHRAVHARHAPQRGLQALDLQRAADQAGGRRRALRDRAPQHPVLALEQRALEAVAQRVEDLRDAKRLEDEVASAGAQRLDRGVEIGEGGDQHHLAGIALRAQLAQPGDAALARQRDVEDDEVEAMAPHQRVGLLGAARREHLADARAQRLVEEVAHARLVVDDQHAGQRPVPVVRRGGVGVGGHGRSMDE